MQNILKSIQIFQSYDHKCAATFFSYSSSVLSVWNVIVSFSRGSVCTLFRWGPHLNNVLMLSHCELDIFFRVCVKHFFLLSAMQKLGKSSVFSRVMISNVLPRFFGSQCILHHTCWAKTAEYFGWLTKVTAHTDYYTLCLKKCPPYSYYCSFYKCWPVFIIFGTQYTELTCNITSIYLSTSPTYYCYTTLGNIGCSSKGLTGQSYMWMHKNWCPITRASFSSILALRLMAVIIMTSYWCSRCCHPFVPLLVTLTYSVETMHQCIVRVRQLSSSAWNSKIYCLQIFLILTL